MPIFAVKSKIEEIEDEKRLTSSHVVLNGLFLMTVAYVEAMHKHMLAYYLKYNPEKTPGKKAIEIDNILLANEDFRFLENVFYKHIEKMPYGQIVKTLYCVLNIHKPENIHAVEIIQNRRNKLIHDNLRIDFKRKSAGDKNHVDAKYLDSALNENRKYLISLEEEI
jgi:hypothetical protein